MCLVALALGCSARYPLVIASNRDEFHARPAAALDWWTPEGHSTEILAGRDLESGGTWLGLGRSGRLALLTNVRDPLHHDAAAPTRGHIVPQWLVGQEPIDVYAAHCAGAGHNGYNLIAADVACDEWHWASNANPRIQRLPQGLYGLSNAELDTPWPKVEALKRRVAASLAADLETEALFADLFAALADRVVVPDDELPSTGVPIELERALAPAFIAMPSRGYGTRCSTLVVTERRGNASVTHVVERSVDAQARVLQTRHAVLHDWPQRTDTTVQKDRDISIVPGPAAPLAGETAAKPLRR